MTELEEKIKDLNIDYLIGVSNAAMDCPDTKESYHYGMVSICAAIVITTPLGRYDIHIRREKNPESLTAPVIQLLSRYYSLAKQRGILDDVKNEERQLPSKEKELTHTNAGGDNTSLKSGGASPVRNNNLRRH